MAAHIDRHWVNREINDFNRRAGDYSSSRRVTPELEKAAFNTLAERIAAHLQMKDRVGDILSHLERSTDDDNGKIFTTAMELIKELNPKPYARSMDRPRVESKSKTVKKIVGESDDDESEEENIVVTLESGDNVMMLDITAKLGKGEAVLERLRDHIGKFEDPDVEDQFWSS